MADGDQRIIPIDPDVPYPLGRHVWHDPRNRAFRALDEPRFAEVAPRTQPWWTRDVYDQLGSSCTMAATVGLLRTNPYRAQLTAAEWALYDTEQERYDAHIESKDHDPWAGRNYEGTSSDAPCKLLVQRGHIDGWRWLFGAAECFEFVETRGAFCVGTEWVWSMFTPDASGTIRDLSGASAGGHEWRVVYHDVKQRRVRGVNSWSRSWGDNGRFWLPDELFVELIDNRQGDAHTIVPLAA